MEAMQELEARKYVWMGAVPLQIHLHESEIATLPAPPPALVLGPRNGYLPLLTSLIKPHFQSFLPPGTDTIWFDYKGLPLKWYIPTGVLFDLLCAEPERPWNITVHFRGYPMDILSPCEGEDSVKWSFINSLKEASYIMNGSTKNVMNMSQADQVELWRCVMKGDIEGYGRVSSRLRPGPVVEDSASGANASKILSQRRTVGETESLGSSRTGRIPLRLYLRDIREELDDLAAAPSVESWDEITYINRPVELPKDEGLVFTLWAALASVLPGLFSNQLSVKESKDFTEAGNNLTKSMPEDESRLAVSDDTSQGETNEKHTSPSTSPQIAREGQDNDLKPLEGSPKASLRGSIEIVRVQGIEPSLDLPFDWVIQNLVAPEHFLHICIYTRNVAESR